MKKKFVKILSFALVSMLSFTGMRVYAAQDASILTAGTAYLNINNSEWGDFEASWTNAEITGDGTYTVSMVATQAQSLAQINALEVADGEAALGSACVLTIDSIRINGEDVELLGDSYTCSADLGGVTTRVNIYNEWSSPNPEAVSGENNHLDNRVAEGEVADATSKLISDEYIDSASGSGFLVQSMEVTFTVSNYGMEAESAPVGPLVVSDEEYPLFIAIGADKEAYNDWGYCYAGEDILNPEAEVNPDITVTNSVARSNTTTEISLEFASPVFYTWYMVPAINIEDLGAMDVDVKVYFDDVLYDELTIDSNEKWWYQAVGNFETKQIVRLDGEYNEWEEECSFPESPTGFSKVTYEIEFGDIQVYNDGMPIDTVSDNEAAFDRHGSYHAHLAVEGPESSVGMNDEESAMMADISDIELKGNGTYTATISNIVCPEDEFASASSYKGIYLLTDIPYSDEVVLKNVLLSADGTPVQIYPVASTSEDGCLMLILQSESVSVGNYSMPASSFELTFDIEGFDYDNLLINSVSANATANKSGLKLGTVILIVVGVVAVFGCGIFVGTIAGKKGKKSDSANKKNVSNKNGKNTKNNKNSRNKNQ